jgi:hypothetical protein
MSPAKKAAAKKAPAKKAPAKKAPAKKAAGAKKTPVKKAAVSDKAAVSKKAAAAKKKAAPSKASKNKAVAKKAPSAKKSVAKKTARVTRPVALPPLPDREPAPSPEDLRDYAPPEGPPVAGPLGEGVEPYRRRPDTVVLTFEGPGPQRRLTVAFRIILAIPHLILLWLVTILALLAAIVGWFASLVLGRLPGGLARFLGQYVQYSTRVSAYSFYLLTDRYPRFSLSDPSYAVSVEVAPGRLNRAAVFFRIILMIPAAILANLVQSGFQLAAVFIWLIVLVSGRLPAPLFEALAAVLRYLTRFQAYFFLLTADYPSGLFGDPA